MMTRCARKLNEILVGAALAAIDVCHLAIAAKAAPQWSLFGSGSAGLGHFKKFVSPVKGRSELQQLDAEIYAH